VDVNFAAAIARRTAENRTSGRTGGPNGQGIRPRLISPTFMNMPSNTAPTITSITEFQLAATIRATGWNSELRRQSGVNVTSASISDAKILVVSSSILQPAIKIRPFRFTRPQSLFSTGAGLAARDAHRPRANRQQRRPPSKIAPPQDTIKLQDRLYYLLQPPLDDLLGTPELEMPFEPFHYQLAGIGFLFPRHAAILADEMGLGKTMQAITAIRLLLHSQEISSVLLVCPKPLTSSWMREFGAWAPEIPIVTIEGEQMRRAWQWRLPDVPVKLANYELLLRDRDQLLDGRMHFDLVVLDEAQRIKNRSSASSHVVRSLSRTRSWALTGTPIENSLADLVGIFDFLSESYLSDGMAPRQMIELTRDYILRRTKQQVLTDLPPKMFRDAAIHLSAEQMESYELAEQSGVVRLKELGEAITIQHVFELVLRLKQICNFDPATHKSSKLEWLEADLDEVVSSGKKAIVFSQWVRTLEWLAERLGPFGVLQYHGRVPCGKRDSVINQFRDDPNYHVMLMSYGAGSVGLNLQFCEYVFLFDRWWNPAVEDQAINRAHRIGAAGPVTVTRFVSLGTIEERIDEILSKKRELFNTMLADTADPRSLGLSQHEIFGLFNLRLPGSRLQAA
jgi:SNF2 family DNA or RNA helicase